jgi:hypothetical protein
MVKRKDGRAPLGCDQVPPQEYAYVDVNGYPSYADVVRVVEGDRRLAPDGYRVVVDDGGGGQDGYSVVVDNGRPRQRPEPQSGLNCVVYKLVCEVRELDTFVRSAIAELQACGREMKCACRANQEELARIKEMIKCIQVVEEEGGPPPQPQPQPQPQPYVVRVPIPQQQRQPPYAPQYYPARPPPPPQQDYSGRQQQAPTAPEIDNRQNYAPVFAQN